MNFKLLPNALTSAALILLCTSVAIADIAELERRARTPPREPARALELGLELRRAGLFDKSSQVLQRASLRAAGEEAARLRLERARSLIAAGKQKVAMAECTALRKASPTSGQICIAEAQLLWKRASTAVTAAEEALALEPNSYDALVVHGRASSALGQPDEATNAFEKAAALDSNRFEAPFHLALLLAKEGKSAEALAAMRRAYQAGPREPEVALELARLLPRDREASDILAKAIDIRPTFGAALALLGDILLAQGKAKEAEEVLERAIKQSSKDAEWHVSLARVHVSTGAFDKALASAKRALALVGNHAGAKLVQADALAGKGDIDLAIEAYETASGYARGEPAPLVHATMACLAGNRPTTARAFAERAVQEFPEWGPAWVALGDALVAVSDPKAARDAYEAALTKRGPVDAAAVAAKLDSLPKKKIKKKAKRKAKRR